jgi:DNA topoisomerase-1
MSCAQKLFEGIDIAGEHIGLITYMRTDSVEFSATFLSELSAYVISTFGEDFYKPPKVAPKAVNAQEGHEALRVVDLNMTPDKLKAHIKNDLLVEVYRLIWERTLAAGLRDASISETSYIISNCDHLFQIATTKIVDLGYRLAYKEKATKESSLKLSKNEVLANTQLIDEAKHTKPPARYKEATLVKELQKQGIGRPSTYATIVDTVLSPTRNYCTLEDKEIVPTEKGVQLAGFLDRSFSSVISLDYTRELEESLDAIAAGKLPRLDFLNAFYTTIEGAIAANKETADEVTGLAAPVCPNCNSTMVIRRSRFGKLFYGCSNYPQCRGIVGIE